MPDLLSSDNTKPYTAWKLQILIQENRDWSSFSLTGGQAKIKEHFCSIICPLLEEEKKMCAFPK